MARGSFTLLFVLSLFFSLHAHASNLRSFSAARKNSQLRRRSANFEPGYDGHNLFFQDDSSRQSAARVGLEPKYPTLILEDVQDHIKDVACSASSMVVQFHSEEAMSIAAASWNKGTTLVFFSSHPTCAAAGEHKAYMVEYVASDSASCSIAFNATKQTLKNVTHRVYIDLGDHLLVDLEARPEPEVVRRLKQRQAQNSDVTTLPPTTSYNQQTASVPPTASFQFASPTATATATSATGDLSFVAINRTMLPPDSVIQQLFPGTSALENVQFGCNNCTMTGSVSLEAAGFDVDSNDLDGVIDFFNTGFFRFSTSKVSAHMKLGLDLLPGFAIHEFTANIARVPLEGIAIKDVITLGPVLDITVPIGLTLNSPVNFTTGFDLTIPDNSQIILNVSEIEGSSQSGFDNTEISILPFSANTDNLSFNLTVGLRPKLTISAGVGDTDLGLGVEGGVGVFMDLPKMVATIDTLNNVNTTCDGPAESGKTNRAVLVSSYSIFDLGLHWELALDIATVNQDRTGEQILVSKTFGLPPQCLVLDPKNSSLVAANASSSADPAGSDSKSNSAAVTNGFSIVSYCMMVLLTVAIGFISL